MPGEISLARETCPVERVIAETHVKGILNAAIELPFMALYIIGIEHHIVNTGAEILGHEIAVTGELLTRVSFVNEENNFQLKNQRTPFRLLKELSSVVPDVIPRARGRVVEGDNSLSEDGFAIACKVDVNFLVKLVELHDLDLVVGIETDFSEDLKVHKRHLNWQVMDKVTWVRECIEENLTLLRSAKRLVCDRAVIRELKADVKDDKVLIGGIMDNYLFFIDDSDCLAHHVRNIPFILDQKLMGAREGQTALLDLFIYPHYVQITGENRKEAEVQFVLEGRLELINSYEKEAVVSVKGLPLKVELQEIELNNITGRMQIQKEVVSISVLEETTDRLYFATSRMDDIVCELNEGMISLNGSISNLIFYRGEGMRLGFKRDQIPFWVECEIPPTISGKKALIDRTAEKNVYRLAGHDSVEHTVKSEVSLLLMEELRIKIIKSAEIVEKSIEESKISKEKYKLYIVQKDDTAGKIAARFRINIQDLLSGNPELKEPGIILPGQKIRIP